jgi:hypothetical protein
MRIVSTFHDFYDGVSRIDEDRSLLYIRETSSKELDLSRFPICQVTNVPGVRTSAFIIGFCGKVYPLIENIYSYFSQNTIKADCFNIEDVDNFFSQLPKKSSEKYYDKPKYKSTSWNNGYRADFENFFNEVNEQKDKYQKFFWEHGQPAFLAGPVRSFRNEYIKNGLEEGTIVFNPRLADIDFMRVFPPYQAYQELSMYLGSQAVPQKPMPKISDEDMRDIKGFDKWSFKKPPSKGK